MCAQLRESTGNSGYIVIVLPSPHAGGRVEATVSETKKAMETAPKSDFDYIYLAWYATVEYAAQKITSRHRLVLEYNLVCTNEAYRQHPIAVLERMQEVPRALERLGRAGQEYSCSHAQWPVAYMLEQIQSSKSSTQPSQRR